MLLIKVSKQMGWIEDHKMGTGSESRERKEKGDLLNIPENYF